MRAIFLAIVLMAPLAPSLAQEPTAKAPKTGQTAQPQLDSTASTSAPLKSNGDRNRVLERTGSGIDWDHRKPGRDWKIRPSREGGWADH